MVRRYRSTWKEGALSAPKGLVDDQAYRSCHVDQGIFPSNYVSDTLIITVISRSDYSPYRSRMFKSQCCILTSNGINNVAIAVLVSLIQTEDREGLGRMQSWVDKPQFRMFAQWRTFLHSPE
jgi:hypothetical protein